MSPSAAERELVANRFRSLFVIGRGGMGSVEVALERGERGFERIIALKRMLPEVSAERKQIDMFLREARVAALLTHPNVVHAFSFGEDKGELFLAMEYVEGEPLSRVLTVAQATADAAGTRTLPAPLIAYILAEICEGLHAAHELRDVSFTPLNLVHRDLSPHNVMVAYEGHVKLLDFGVVKIAEIDPQQGLTKTGEVKGKTAYMSPEQAMGDPIDRRSDLYSMGAMLFECLAGQRMWGLGTDFDVLRKLALEEPPPLATVAPDAPPALCDLQRRLVSRDREKRPPTARAVGEELRRFIGACGEAEPDARVVRALMQRLFEKEIARRHDALTRALAEAAPSEGEELRKSLAPSGYSETAIEIAAPHGVARPAVVRVHPRDGTSGSATLTVGAPPRSNGSLAWAVGATALLAMGGVAFLGLRPPPKANGVVPEPATTDTVTTRKDAGPAIVDPPQASSPPLSVPHPASPSATTTTTKATLPTAIRTERPAPSGKADPPSQARPDAGGSMRSRSERRPGRVKGCLLSLALLVAPALLTAPALADGQHQDDDALSAYRERFRAGMEKYKSGNMSEAIQYWEPIYREIGPAKGYRLSFDLARAYESYGESTRAAERYESFLGELAARRDAHEELEPIVLREEEEAKKRLGELQAAKGRIRVVPGTRPLLAQVDLAEPRLGAFVSYVAPGRHEVTFAPGSTDAEKHTVDVKAGEVADVAPNPLAPPEPPPPSRAAEDRHPPLIPVTVEKTHPFSPMWIVVAGGATALAVLVPVATYLDAQSIGNRYDQTGSPGLRSAYNGQVKTAYASLAVPIGLAAVTAGLATWYLAGTKEANVDTKLSGGLTPARGGATGVIEGRF